MFSRKPARAHADSVSGREVRWKATSSFPRMRAWKSEAVIKSICDILHNMSEGGVLLIISMRTILEMGEHVKMFMYFFYMMA